MGLTRQSTSITPTVWAAITKSSSAMSQVQELQRMPDALPRPSSMLFDLEMEEVPSIPRLDAEAHHAVAAVQKLVSRSTTLCCEVVRDVEAARKALLARGKTVCAASLAEALSQLGYSVAIRESLGGGSGGKCVQLRSSGSNTASTIIVDPSFRDQFDIAHKTLRYAAVLDSIPAVFVGPDSKLPALVEVLCSEMSLAFHSTGTVLPPWRYTKSMLSKWQPRQSIDLSLPLLRPTAADPAGSAAKQQLECPPRPPLDVLRSSFLYRTVRAVSEASGNSGSSSSSCHYLVMGKSAASSTHSRGSGSEAADSAAAAEQAVMTSVSSSDENQTLLAVAPQQSMAQEPQPEQADAASIQFHQSLCSPKRARSDAVIGFSTEGSDLLPARRQMSYEPKKRVVGGFAASVQSGSLLTLAQ